VARWRRGEGLAAWEKALRAALDENRVSASEEFEAVEPPEQKPLEQVAPPIDPWFRFNNIQDAWRWDAQAAGLSAQDIEESWAWYARHASGAPPVIEEGERALPETMPESVRRVLTRNIRYVFLAEDPFVDDLLDAFKQPVPIPDDLQRTAEDWQFWDDVGRALNDPPDADDKRALDRLARLVKLKPEHTRQLAETSNTSMEATKRRLVQEAVVLSLAAANAPIRIGRRKGKDEDAHPIRLQDVFGEEGYQDILSELLRNNLGSRSQESPAEIKDKLERSLGGPFRPASLTDRAVYRTWLTKEIQRQTGVLLGQDLDIRDADRVGGSRRQEDSYDETDHSVAGVARGQLGPDTLAFTDNQRRATGEREDQKQVRFPWTDFYTKQRKALEKKEQIEQAYADRIDWQQALDRLWQEREAPVLRRYIACVRQESELYNDDVAAARKLDWTDEKVRDVKRRLNRYIGQAAAEQRWKSLFPKGL